MPKNIKISIISIVAIFIFSIIACICIATHKNESSGSKYVEIIKDGEVLYTIDLTTAKNQTITINDKNGGYNTIHILDGNIKISESDCPDQTCVKTGILRSENIPIVCLPHKLIIKFCDEEN